MSRAKKKPALSAAVAPETPEAALTPQPAPEAAAASTPPPATEAAAGHRSNIMLAHGQPPVTEGDLGWRAITLPAEAQQRAGWYEPRAAEILKLYGGIYKPVVDKGGN